MSHTRLLKIRDVSLFTEVVGDGYPLVLMHGGPGLDHFTLLPFRQLADRFTLIFTTTGATAARRGQ